MAESKYKIGDTVTIKNLVGVTGSDYRFGINSNMRELSGCSFKIVNIDKAKPITADRIPDDGYRYTLNGEASLWSWASSMFVDSPRDSITYSVVETKESSIDVFINKKKCPVLDFTL